MAELTPRVNLHTHTCYSFDCETDPRTLCEAAVATGITAVAITDHVEMPQWVEADTAASVAAARALQVEYADRLTVLAGVELGQALHDVVQSERLLSTYTFDVVLGSVHNLRGEQDFYYIPPADPRLPVLLDRYFEEMLELVTWGKFDVLTHLTYPWRYLAADARTAALAQRWDRVEAVLAALAHSGKALEINTSGYREGLGEPLPGMAVVRRFRELGGEYITVGSDAHTPQAVNDSIDRGLAVAKQAGFTHITVYRNRTPHQVAL